jgi:hypothetical protein
MSTSVFLGWGGRKKPGLQGRISEIGIGTPIRISERGGEKNLPPLLRISQVDFGTPKNSGGSHLVQIT